MWGQMTTRITITLPLTKRLQGEPNSMCADVNALPGGAIAQGLLHYDEQGKLDGELVFMPWCGDVVIAVRPDRRRQGIGRQMVIQGMALWPKLNPACQVFASDEGKALARSVLRKLGECC